MNLTVKGHRIFIRPEQLPEMNEAGTLHLVNYRGQSTMKGVVVAVGNGPELVAEAVNGVLDAVSNAIDNKYVRATINDIRVCYRLEHLRIVQVGDRVLFSPNSGEEIIFEHDVFVVLQEDDVLAIIEEEAV